MRVEEIEDVDAPRCHPDGQSHNEGPLEDLEIMEIIKEFVHI